MEPYLGPKKRLALYLSTLLAVAGLLANCANVQVSAVPGESTRLTGKPTPSATLKLTAVPRTLQPAPAATATPEPSPTPKPILESWPVPKIGNVLQTKSGIICQYINLSAAGSIKINDGWLKIYFTEEGKLVWNYSKGVLVFRDPRGDTLLGFPATEASETRGFYPDGEFLPLGLYCEGTGRKGHEFSQEDFESLDKFLPYSEISF